MEPVQRANLSAQAMWRDDEASRSAGLVKHEVGPGYAVFSFDVAPNHANGHGICHGGFIFLLADTTFAYACNSYNQTCVAYHNSITYITSAHVGDKLTASACEVSLKGRNGIYDVRVENKSGETIAQFRGLSRRVKGQWFDENAIEGNGNG